MISESKLNFPYKININAHIIMKRSPTWCWTCCAEWSRRFYQKNTNKQNKCINVTSFKNWSGMGWLCRDYGVRGLFGAERHF